MTITSPLVLLVLDGFGIRAERDHNAIALARTPVYDALLARYPHAQLIASGEAVGLPAGQMGNSEVGHTNMGAGRVVYQDLTRIDKAIRDGELAGNPVLDACYARCADGTRALHLIGLVSDGGVHSHQRHLHALLELAAARGLPRVFVHAITDGRDASPRRQRALHPAARSRSCAARAGASPPSSAGISRWIATSAGSGPDSPTTPSCTGRPIRPVDRRKKRCAGHTRDGITDEFVKPVVIVDAAQAPVGPIRDGDSVLFFNFRADRARQIIARARPSRLRRVRSRRPSGRSTTRR